MVGIAEDDLGRARDVVGVDLTRLAERVDAVARSNIDPPLVVRARPEIEDPDRPGYGVLLIEVPPSGQAPHMVDHVYYGRADRAKMKLSDPQVREVIQRRLLARADMPSKLQDLADHDPVSPEVRTNGHLYLVVHPTAARDDALLDVFNGNPVQELDDAVLRAARAGGTLRIAPEITGGVWQRRSAGYTSTQGVRESGEIREDSLLELTVREDGGVMLLCGRGTSLAYRQGGFDNRTVPGVIPNLVIGLVYRALALAGDLADRHSGYQGQWQIGLRLDGLHGAVASDYLSPGGWQDVHPYDRDTYAELTECTTAELVDRTEAATERLVARLLRALSVAPRYLPLPPPPRL